MRLWESCVNSEMYLERPIQSATRIALQTLFILSGFAYVETEIWLRNLLGRISIHLNSLSAIGIYHAVAVS